MTLLLFLVNLSFPAGAEAIWSCVTGEGKLLSCDSPSYCRKYYPSCAKSGEFQEEEAEACKNPRCAPPVAPAKPVVHDEPVGAVDPGTPTKPRAKKAEPKKPEPAKAAVPSGEPQEKRTEVKSESAPALAAQRISQLKSMVKKSKSQAAPAPKGAAGLSAEEEARLFGNPEVNSAARVPQESPWLNYMSASTHSRLVEELRKNRHLREELRKRLANMPTNTVEDRETKATMQSMLSAAELKAKEVGKSLDDVSPLSSEEAFQLPEEEVDELQKRGATK